MVELSINVKLYPKQLFCIIVPDSKVTALTKGIKNIAKTNRKILSFFFEISF